MTLEYILIYLILFVGIACTCLICYFYFQNKKEKGLLKKELLNVNSILQETIELKETLYSILAHDLRSPFASLESLMVLYSFEEYNLNQTKGFLNHIRTVSTFTIQKLENIVYYVKIRTNPLFKGTIEAFNLQQSVNDVIELFSEISLQKNLSVKVLNDKSFYIQENKFEIELVLKNLISNAIKFTKDKGEIVIALETIQNYKIQFKITDNGIGIKEELLPTIFHKTQSFKQSHNKTGLGLVLCSTLLKGDRGSIEVKSKVNEGSIFSFTLNYPKLDPSN